MRPVTVVSPANIQDLDRGDLWSAASHVQREEQWGENTSLRGASADHESPRCEFPQPHLLLPVCHEAETDWVKTRRAGSVYLREDQAWWYRRPKGEIGFFINKTQTTISNTFMFENFAAKQDTNIFLCKTHTPHTHTLAHTQTTSLHPSHTRASYQEQVTGTLWFCHLALIQTAMTLCGDIIAVIICLKSFKQCHRRPCARSNET